MSPLAPTGPDAAHVQGRVAPPLGDEFAGLGISWIVCERGTGRSPKELRERLRYMSNRIGGRQAIELRNQDVPHAYRVFFRQIGIDPDETPTPIEEAVLRRLQRGGFRSEGLVEDALLIGIVETGVALTAFDADRVEGALGIRAALAGESLEGGASDVGEGSLVIADELGPVSRLFGEAGDRARVTKQTRRTAIAAIQVGAISQMSVSEALWTASEVMAAG